MKRRITGLQGKPQPADDTLEGAFLVRVDRPFYRWHPQRPFYVLRFTILEPSEHQSRFFTGRLYCSPKALWKLRWFPRDFGYDQNLMGRDEEWTKRLSSACRGSCTSLTTLNSHTFLNLGGFAPASEWEELSRSAGNTREVPRDL